MTCSEHELVEQRSERAVMCSEHELVKVRWSVQERAPNVHEWPPRGEI